MKTAFNLKKAVIIIFLLIAGTIKGFAQCDQTVTLTSSKTSKVDAQGNTDSRDENTVITITKTEVTIVPGGDDHKMSGTISSKTCDWKTPFKEGKTVIKAKLSDEDHAHERTATITITGVAGKITLMFEAEEKPGMKIFVVADKFE
ncbi:hypothetical protein [Mucilaginibacter ginsenosidivorax]|uniref:Lipocalin-like domain-containing protein n=1 Tax=Mucilaginibacter ginsenosidivorax TaxID=862126 RepID=A0A5B8W676_9SPHI|nr:hypothetical protein [Mucilaginibacter ginsenosidivorax]QEC79374.1 hypothetical protein FSB76_26755 [Mucilaginibacter ginsenosidivorax]